MSYLIHISLKEMTAYINRYVTYTFIFIILSITISELLCVRCSVLLWLYWGRGGPGCWRLLGFCHCLFWTPYGTILHLLKTQARVSVVFSYVSHLIPILTLKRIILFMFLLLLLLFLGFLGGLFSFWDEK